MNPQHNVAECISPFNWQQALPNRPDQIRRSALNQRSYFGVVPKLVFAGRILVAPGGKPLPRFVIEPVRFPCLMDPGLLFWV